MHLPSFLGDIKLPHHGDILPGVFLFFGGAVTTSVLIALQRRRAARNSIAGRSTTSSAGGGAAAYETRKAVDEYLQFHFGQEDPAFFPYKSINPPTRALQFCEELALLCERHCTALHDFTGESPTPAALDIGCAVGGATFALAKAFPLVMGIDYSSHFVSAAQVMQSRGWMRYRATEEADITIERVASVPEEVDRSRVKFQQGDACALSPDLGPFDAVLMANLLCRLPKPKILLERLKTLVAPGGVAVIVSPYSWLEAWTPRQEWLGGTYDSSNKSSDNSGKKDGGESWSSDGLAKIMSEKFELVEQKDVPFMIREHNRKYQLGVSHATVWRRKTD
jgi:putative 4-mercaptohistidine N1-methyltranferase